MRSSRRHDVLVPIGVGLAVGLGLVLIGRRASAAPGTSAPTSRVSARPLPLPPGWDRYPGARPEIRGFPADTILAIPGLEKVSAEVRKALLDLAEEVGVPVDSIATVIGHESGWKAGALYQDPTNEQRRAEGRSEFYAAGLVQLTPGAHLPGFESAEKVKAIASMSAEEQMRAVVAPLWRLHKGVKGAHPGLALLANFLPAHVGKPESFVLGDRDAASDDKAAKFLRDVYRQNGGFDKDHDGKVTIAEVYASAGKVAARANDERLTIRGERIAGEAAAPAAAAPTARPGSTASLATATASAPPSVDAKAASPVAPSASPKAPSAPSSAPSAPAPRAWPPPALALDSLAGGYLLAAVRANAHEAPVFVEVPWVGSHNTEGLRLRLRVSTHALRAPVEIQGQGSKLLRLPVSYREVIEICRLKGWLPMTQTQSDAVWAAAKHLTPKPLGHRDTPEGNAKADHDMTRFAFVLQINDHYDRQIGDNWQSLWRDDGKDWILHPRITEKGAVNYGWRKPDGTPWQGVGARHDPKHFDYSQTFLAMNRLALDESGAEVDLLEVLKARWAGDPQILAAFL